MGHDDDSTPPDDYMCPLSLCLMDDPVTTMAGSVYERAQIAEWLRDNVTDPKTNTKMRSKKLVPAHLVKGMIQQWREEHPDYKV